MIGMRTKLRVNVEKFKVTVVKRIGIACKDEGKRRKLRVNVAKIRVTVDERIGITCKDEVDL